MASYSLNNIKIGVVIWLFQFFFIPLQKIKFNMNTQQLEKGNALLEKISKVKGEQEGLVKAYNNPYKTKRFGISFSRDYGMSWLSEVSEKTQEAVFHALNSELVSKIQALEKEFEEL